MNEKEFDEKELFDKLVEAIKINKFSPYRCAGCDGRKIYYWEQNKLKIENTCIHKYYDKYEIIDGLKTLRGEINYLFRENDTGMIDYIKKFIENSNPILEN